MLSWKNGRQKGSSYKVVKLFESQRFNFDIYIIKMEVGDFINPHIDHSPIEDMIHYRLNILLKKPLKGGRFFTIDKNTKEKTFYKSFVKFASSEVIHGVTKVISGTRYLLSIGWLNDKKGSNYET